MEYPTSPKGPATSRDVTHYLVTHKEELNLSQISRRAGMNSQYLKHVVAGRRTMAQNVAVRVREVLRDMIISHFQGESSASK